MVCGNETVSVISTGTSQNGVYFKPSKEGTSTIILVTHENIKNSDVPSTSTERAEKCGDPGKNIEENPLTVVSLPRKQKLLLLALAIAQFTGMLCFSHIAPFFPKVAEEKGMTLTVSGWVFASFAVGMFFCCPLFGKLIPIVGARFSFLAGLFLTGGSTFLFGFLTYIDAGASYTVQCFVLRISASVGSAAVVTSASTITAQQFPTMVNTAFGWLETFVGLGMMIGPAVGGALYDLGGFSLPFYSIGGWTFLSLIFASMLVPQEGKTVHQSEKPGDVLKMVSSMRILILMSTIVAVSSIWSGLDPTLEPHLRMFDLSPSVVGLFFLLLAGVYSIFSPLWGIMADKIGDAHILMAIGMFISILGVLLLGSSPILGFDEDFHVLWTNVLSLCILGASMSMVITPSYSVLFTSAFKIGMADTVGTKAIVAALWHAAYSIGIFIGAVLCGWIFDEVGFKWAMTYISFISCGSLIALVSLIVYDRWKPRETSSTPTNEKTPLLE